MAKHLIDKFISEKYGTEWKKGPEFTLVDPNSPGNNLKAITIILPNEEITHFYFDISRPITNAMRMLGIE